MECLFQRFHRCHAIIYKQIISLQEGNQLLGNKLKFSGHCHLIFLIERSVVIRRDKRNATQTHNIDRRLLFQEVITVFCSSQEAGHLKNLETGRPDPPSLLFFSQSTFTKPLLCTKQWKHKPEEPVVPSPEELTVRGRANNELCPYTTKRGAEGDPSSTPRGAISTTSSFQTYGNKATTKPKPVCPRDKTGAVGL